MMKKLGNDLYFTVSGKGSFPVDMLRYDDCAFASDGDRDAAEVEVDGDVEIVVDMVIENAGGRKPSVARWQSFGWSVEGAGNSRKVQDRRAAVWSNLLVSLTP
jgi:hypothetical protein